MQIREVQSSIVVSFPAFERGPGARKKRIADDAGSAGSDGLTNVECPDLRQNK